MRRKLAATLALATTALVGCSVLEPARDEIPAAPEGAAVGGTITVAADGTPSVDAEIDVASITTDNEQRDGHLKTGDFFEVEKYPTATFTSTSIKADGGNFVLTGDFTLHGVTNSVDLELEFNGVNAGMGNGPVAGFEAKAVINRRDFGITIDMPLEGGGAVVGDKITLNLEIEAGLQG